MLADFNVQEGKWLLDTFLYQHELHSVNKNSTCYKHSTNPSNIDLILTNCSKSFSKMDRLFTGLSDFHKLVLSVSKTTFTKSKSKEIVYVYRNYKKFNENNFNQDVHNQLLSEQPKDYATFKKLVLSILVEHASPKKKLQRANHGPYVIKALRKAIMRRSY